LLFSVFLAYLWIARGDDVNCGCFGDDIWMSPSVSLLKNAFLLIAMFVIHHFHRGITARWANITSLVVFVSITVLPFILFALPDQQPTWLQKDRFELRMEPLYDQQLSKPVPSIDLKKGKHVIAFFSLKCPHCKMAARKMQIMKEKNPALPFFFVVAGKDKYLPEFWKETHAESVPHTKLDGDSFTNMVGYAWPVIYFVNDGWVEANSNYIALSQEEIEKWLKKP
jgi:glutaredoxin